MADPVSLCNRALGQIASRNTITAIGAPDNSNEADQCAIYYDPVRQQCLRAARWNFASKMITLTLLKAALGTPENPSTTATNWNSTFPQYPWLYSYAYPNDAVAVNRLPIVYPLALTGVPLTTAPQPFLFNQTSNALENSSSRFAVAQDTNSQGAPIKVILSNQDQAIGVYTADVVVPNLFDALFQEALVAGLAGQLAMALSGDKVMASRQFQLANERLMQARAADGNEGITVIDHIPDWITARGTGTTWGQSSLGYLGEPYGALFGGSI